MARFKVGHVKLEGIDVVLVPLSDEITRLSAADQTLALRQLVQICRAARLGGEVIPVWQTPQATLGFVANEKVHPVVSANLNPAFLKANLNREVNAPTVESPLARLLGLAPTAAARPAVAPAAPTGTTTQPTRSPETGPGFLKRRERPTPGEDGRSPTRLVTLLFSDVVKSTRLKQEYGDHRGLELIRKHHDIFRYLLASVGGEEVGSAGDSFFAAFPTPSAAVIFSLKLQARLRQPIDENIRVQDRIGIHLGEVFIEPIQGGAGDLYGIQVDTCARIMALATGDQILMSRPVFENARQLLRGQQIPGIGAVTWLAHGPYELKGVEDTVELCEAGESGRAVLRQPPDAPAGRRATEAIRPPL